MKTLLLIVTLFTLAACNGGDGSKSGSSKSALGDGAGYLTAKFETTISKSSGSYEILSNESSYVSEVIDGLEYSCSMSVYSGDTLSYKINGKKMTIGRDGKFSEMDRLKGNGNELNGTWQLVDDKTTLFLTFDNNKLTMELKCEY